MPPIVGDLEHFLGEMVAGLEPEPPRPGGPGRPRVLPSLVLWTALLVCVLRGFSSQLAVWRLLTERGVRFYPRLPLSDQAIYKRLANEGTQALAQVFLRVQSTLAARLDPFLVARPLLAPFATEVIALDESTLDRLARTLPALGEVKAGDPRLLPGKIAGLFDVRRQLWRTILPIANPLQNEKVAARELVETLPHGSLILADLGYFGFAWFDWLTERGYHWISRVREKTSYEVLHVYYDDGVIFDGLVWLGRYRADRAASAVRLVSFPVGPTTLRYITNVRDPQVLSLRDIAVLDARRWDFELAVLLVKEQLNLHVFWSAKASVVEAQVWAVVIIAQILHALRWEVALRADADPFEVSLPLLVEYFPQYAAEDAIRSRSSSRRDDVCASFAPRAERSSVPRSFLPTPSSLCPQTWSWSARRATPNGGVTDQPSKLISWSQW
jgi:hypothetical protein